MRNNKVFVTRTFLPPIEEYFEYLKRAWSKKWITNHGELALELEHKLEKLTGVKHALFVSNGTLAIQLALKALQIHGEVITTPFSFAATTTSILWEKCKPIFVDIDPETFTIDPDKIEASITKDTKAILAVHVYGYPCDVRKIEIIAKKHNLKVIYDAAHAFGTKVDGNSIFHFGDVSTLSLHATKLFHSVEGGVIFTNNDNLAKKIEHLRDFGLEGGEIVEIGINAKNSEFHAAMGLANLKYVYSIMNARKKIIDKYKELLGDTNLHPVRYFKNISYNDAYFPVVFSSEEVLLSVKEALNKDNIYPRRYFHPSLNTLPYIQYQPCPISESIAIRVLCLPLYHSLTNAEVKHIVNIIKSKILL